MFDTLQKSAQERIAREKAREHFISQIMASSGELDSVINFRISSSAKAEFERLCKENHSTVSRELKVFIFNSIKRGRTSA